MTEPKLIKVWVIRSKKYGEGFFTETPSDFLCEFPLMEDDDEFTIKVKYLTRKQIKNSHEFNGW